MPVPFQVRTNSEEGEIHHIFVCGELDLGTAPQLSHALGEAVGDGEASILVNLSDCEFIDSSGLALLVESWRELEDRPADNRLALCCAGGQVQKLLRITGTDEAIPVYHGVDEALSYLRS